MKANESTRQSWPASHARGDARAFDSRSALLYRSRQSIVNSRSLRVAVLVPCYNEEVAIADTVKGMQAVLPDATVYVYDNNSSDQTSARAREAGAVVYVERLQGKGNVVRRMFSD